MAIYLSNRDGGKTDEQGHYKFQTAAFKGNVLESGFTVTQNSPLGMSVIVGGGDAKIPYSDYAYTAWIPDASPETVAVTTANPSNPRIDRLVLYVDRGETPSSGTANNPTIPKLMLVAGTPAGSPSRPSNGTVNTAVSSNPYIDLADILVGAGVTQITNANITRTAVGAYPVIADKSVNQTKITNPYRFSAYVGTVQTLAAATNVVAALNTELFDPNGDFNTTTYKYVAPVDGDYQISAQCAIGSGGINGTAFAQAYLTVGGSAKAYSMRLQGTGNTNTLTRFQISKLIRMTAGQELTLVGYCSEARNIDAGESITYMTGYLVNAN